jgi:hypothetical protein
MESGRRACNPPAAPSRLGSTNPVALTCAGSRITTGPRRPGGHGSAFPANVAVCCRIETFWRTMRAGTCVLNHTCALNLDFHHKLLYCSQLYVTNVQLLTFMFCLILGLPPAPISARHSSRYEWCRWEVLNCRQLKLLLQFSLVAFVTMAAAEGPSYVPWGGFWPPHGTRPMPRCQGEFWKRVAGTRAAPSDDGIGAHSAR